MGKYTCSLCDYETDRIFNYNKHLSSLKHVNINGVDINKLSCNFCSKMIYKSNMARHYKSCKNVKPDLSNIENKIQCIHCIKYIYKSNMKRHLLSCKSKKDIDNEYIDDYSDESDYLPNNKLKNELCDIKIKYDRLVGQNLEFAGFLDYTFKKYNV
jgi:hypothetical protein